MSLASLISALAGILAKAEGDIKIPKAIADAAIEAAKEAKKQQKNLQEKGLDVWENRYELVRRALLKTDGNKKAAARLLGVSTKTLYRWLDYSSVDAK